MNRRRRNVLIIGAAGVGFIIAIAVTGAIYIDFAPAFTLVLYAGLIVVTMLYAYFSMETADAAREQADASLKMAEEMREARYDTLRPIIDIVHMPKMPIELASNAYAQEPPKELACKLCNVGVGPATDVYSFVYHDSGKQQLRNFDTIVIGKEIGSERLSVVQKDDHWFLVVYYKDVYGRWFESSREVRVGVVNPDPLQILKKTEEELP